MFKNSYPATAVIIPAGMKSPGSTSASSDLILACEEVNAATGTVLYISHAKVCISCSTTGCVNIHRRSLVSPFAVGYIDIRPYCNNNEQLLIEM